MKKTDNPMEEKTSKKTRHFPREKNRNKPTTPWWVFIVYNSNPKFCLQGLLQTWPPKDSLPPTFSKTFKQSNLLFLKYTLSFPLARLWKANTNAAASGIPPDCNHAHTIHPLWHEDARSSICFKMPPDPCILPLFQIFPFSVHLLSFNQTLKLAEVRKHISL